MASASSRKRTLLKVIILGDSGWVADESRECLCRVLVKLPLPQGLPFLSFGRHARPPAGWGRRHL